MAEKACHVVTSTAQVGLIQALAIVGVFVKLLYKIFACCVVLSVLAAGVLAYFIRKVDVDRQIVYDGFGRTLSRPPEWVQFLINETVWAGGAWRLVEIVVFFGGLYLALQLFILGQSEPESFNPATGELTQSQLEQVEMLKETLDLMGTDTYAAMGENDRKAAIGEIEMRHGSTKRLQHGAQGDG